MSDDFRTFEDFWPYYVGEHAKPITRWMHFAGTAAFLACATTFVVTRRPRWLLASAIAGYGPAWVSHFFLEHNRPATFKHPVWSLLADFRMFGLMATGRMKAEIERLKTRAATSSDAPSTSDVEPDARSMN